MPSPTDKDSVCPPLRQAGARCNPESAGDRLRKEALARNICGRICNAERTHDELRVVDDVLAGIEKAFPKMGGMDLASDARDFDEEAAQECRDLLAYLAMRKVAEQHKRREAIEGVVDSLAKLAEAGLAADDPAIDQVRREMWLPPAPVGDDHTPEMCREKFAHVVPYGNAPDPRDNPFTDDEEG